jgi:hypothetical protein
MVNKVNFDLLIDQVGVSTIALSLSSMDSDTNAEINRTPDSIAFDIDVLARQVKGQGLNLRLCLNLSSAYNSMGVEDMLARAHQLGADQLTFRKLFVSDIYTGTPQGQWIREHQFRENGLAEIAAYIKQQGVELYRLPFGASVYSVNGMSVVVDQDCMNKTVRDDGSIKYLILRPDCHLYCRWDDHGSLIF